VVGDREGLAHVRVSASQAAGTTARPCDRPSSGSICPDLAISRAVAEITPSWTAEPSGSQMISASLSAPIGCQVRHLTSRRNPRACSMSRRTGEILALRGMATVRTPNTSRPRSVAGLALAAVGGDRVACRNERLAT
jgi:hypothetical protein